MKRLGWQSRRCEEKSSLDFYCTKLQKGFLVQSGLLSKWDKGSLGDPDILNLSWENGIQFIMSAWASRLRFLLYNSVRFSSVMSACCSSNAVSDMLQKKKNYILSSIQFIVWKSFHVTAYVINLILLQTGYNVTNCIHFATAQKAIWGGYSLLWADCERLLSRHGCGLSSIHLKPSWPWLPFSLNNKGLSLWANTA